jgi:hypothetical protein
VQEQFLSYNSSTLHSSLNGHTQSGKKFMPAAYIWLALHSKYFLFASIALTGYVESFLMHLTSSIALTGYVESFLMHLTSTLLVVL